VDMGTGSGAIAIGLAKVMPSAEVHGVDISEEALAVARLNAQRQGVEVHFHQGSWYGAIPQLAGRVTGIVANPPYIPSKEIGALAREVRCHEPLLALDGGERGLDGIMRLLADAPLFVVRGGYVVLEVMAGQAAIVKGALERLSDFRGVQVYRDLEMVERFVVARIA
jgi:release factor glutamine methyltransferase